MESILKEYSCNIFYEINQYSGSKLIDTNTIFETDKQVSVKDAIWKLSKETNKDDDLKMQMKFALLSGAAKETNASFCMKFSNWSTENYVMMPAAVYNGNRFISKKISYPPIVHEVKDIGVDAPTVITDVPRLNIGEGNSAINLLSRDMSTPAIGVYFPSINKGLWIVTPQYTKQGDIGIEIVESDDREECIIKISAPGVRREKRYTMCSMDYPSEDKGADLEQGDSVIIDMQFHFFESESIPKFVDSFFGVRKTYSKHDKGKNLLPFSVSSKILIDKYNRENWDSKYGYYTVGVGDSPYSKWQIGWVGGMMTTYALLQDGNAETAARALKNIEFILGNGQGLSGFYYGMGDGENWYGDNFRNHSDKRWHLIRKSADALYYIIKQFELFKHMSKGVEVKQSWDISAKKCADAFVRLWNKRGQFGQFVNSETGDIIVGNSSSAGLAAGALALASKYFNNSEYRNSACQAGEYYYKNFILKGITNGGPGEICQCPDSESAFALLESYITLYEVTEDKHWLDYAKDTANLCATWCVSYNYRFPKGSTFSNLDMDTIGTVYANVQNKHSSPGICTLSGISLFKLFRYTGEERYMELFEEITHSLPQFLSREERPISMLPNGWINERVELSDWLEPPGEVFDSSCWPEATLMLTYCEVPGIYIQPDIKRVYCFDHAEADIIEETEDRIKIRVKNPTDYNAKYKLYIEKSSKMEDILGVNFMIHPQYVDICANKQVEFWISKNEASICY